MSLQIASIVFNDSASQFNKDLTEYLQRNLDAAIRRGGLMFQFKIAKPADLSELRATGIKRLPAMIINETPYIGVPEIIKEINLRIRAARAEIPEKTDDEVVRDFQTQILGKPIKDAGGNIKYEDDDEEDNPQKEAAQLLNSYSREVSRRGGTNININNKGAQKEYPNPNQSRNQVNEYDNEQHVDPPAQTGRTNNLTFNEDIQGSIKRAGQVHNGEPNDAQDDAMMAAMMDRLGGD